ncbi:MAG: PAS domain S-box protein [Oscillatoriales cyanobacterium RU_3_3]|nr:PAS domain S-box protein [Oscillatoriales cyanobacterium RU_3_3]NJR24841.1 PAS domain S-box protein [Richelia sp. CSU_2_1]
MYGMPDRKLLEIFLENTPTAVAVLDSQMRYIAASKRWLSDFGLVDTELEGRSHWDVFPRIRDRCKQVYHDSLAGESRSCEQVVINADGSADWMNWDIRPWLDSCGEIGGVIIFSEVITERKSELNYRSIFDAANDLIFICDIETGEIVDVNQTTADVLGYAQSEIKCLGVSVLCLEVAPYSIENLRELMQKAVLGEPQIFEWKTRNKQGRRFWVEISLKLAQIGDNLRLLAAVRDITDRKRVVDALRKSEAREREKAQRQELLNQLAGQIRQSLELTAILETAVSEIRNLLQIDRCSFAWYKPYNNPPVWEIVTESCAADIDSLTGVYPAPDVENATECDLRSEILWVDDVSEFLQPSHREMVLSLGYKSLLSLPVRTASGLTGAIVCGNCRSPRAWKDAEVELLQAVAAQLAIAVNQADLYAQTREAANIAREQAKQLEQTLYELKRAQSQLIQTEKMSSLGRLVAGVAHEINNPVNFIYGNLSHAKVYVQELLELVQLYQAEYPEPAAAIFETMEDMDFEFLIDDLPKLMASMEVGADRIREIVRSLRNFSRLDEAEMKFVDIHAGIDSTLMILQNRLKSQHERPEIEVVKEYGELPQIECRAGQLNQVFMNILTNAIDALEERDSKRSIEEITLRPSRITIVTEVQQQDAAFFAVIRIADNGVGMKEQVQEHLFEPFFTTKPVGKGTGLGLAISYQIVIEKHRGNLHCFSQEGAGTEFAIEIPIKQGN